MVGDARTGLIAGTTARLVFAAAAAIIVTAIVPPLIALAGRATDWNVLAAAAPWRLLARSVAEAAAVTAIALAIGAPLGLAIATGRVRGGRIALAVHAFPLALPPLIVALGADHALASAGAQSVLRAPGARIAILATALAPVITLLTFAAATRLPRSLLDAATLVAAPRRVAWRIALPLIWPAARIGATIVFALALADAAVALHLGVPSYAATLFTRLGGAVYAPGEAAALAAPLVVIALVLAIVVRADPVRFPPRPWASWRGAPGWVPTGLAWAAAAIAAVPIVALASRSGFAGFTAAGDWLDRVVMTTLITSATAASLATAAAVVIGHRAARGGRDAGAIITLAWIGFFVPPTVLAIGMVAAWNHATTGWIYDTVAVLALGGLARHAVIALRPAASIVGARPLGGEEAAAVAGAGYIRRLGLVVRIHAREVAVVWALVAIACIRDVETAAVYYPPGGETLAVRIFTLDANGPPRVVAALACIQVAITAALALAAVAIGRGRGR